MRVSQRLETSSTTKKGREAVDCGVFAAGNIGGTATTPQGLSLEACVPLAI